MTDILLIALFAFLGAAAAGLLGAGVLRLLRHRSLVVPVSVVAGVARPGDARRDADGRLGDVPLVP